MKRILIVLALLSLVLVGCGEPVEESEGYTGGEVIHDNIDCLKDSDCDSDEICVEGDCVVVIDLDEVIKDILGDETVMRADVETIECPLYRTTLEFQEFNIPFNGDGTVREFFPHWGYNLPSGDYSHLLDNDRFEVRSIQFAEGSYIEYDCFESCGSDCLKLIRCRSYDISDIEIYDLVEKEEVSKKWGNHLMYGWHYPTHGIPQILVYYNDSNNAVVYLQGEIMYEDKRGRYVGCDR